MTHTTSFKKEVYDFYHGDGEQNKAKTGRKFGISPRSVGRYLADVCGMGASKEVTLSTDEKMKSGEKVNWIEPIPFPCNDLFKVEPIIPPAVPVYLYRTEEMITLIKVGGGSVVVNKADKVKWDTVTTILDNALVVDAEVLESAFEEASTTAKIMKYQHKYKNLIVDLYVGSVYVLMAGIKYPVNSRLSSRLLGMLENNEDVTALAKFTQKLMQNPSKDVVVDLFDFLTAADVKIDDNGDVVCYKKIKEDFTDIYTGTIRNDIGVTVSMPRSEVVENRNKTCSSGLHVCSKSYLPHYGGYVESPRVVKVIVEPQDFVSIPTDYSFAKARVCRYKVVADVTKQYKEGKL
jgi:hypothetical protein